MQRIKLLTAAGILVALGSQSPAEDRVYRGSPLHPVDANSANFDTNAMWSSSTKNNMKTNLDKMGVQNGLPQQFTIPPKPSPQREIRNQDHKGDMEQDQNRKQLNQMRCGQDECATSNSRIRTPNLPSAINPALIPRGVGSAGNVAVNAHVSASPIRAPAVRTINVRPPTINVRPPSASTITSDSRLKRDIVEVGTLPSGLHLYRYRYLWSERVYVGVMAQEVSTFAPAAVVVGDDGYLSVDYSQLGLQLQTWDEWTAQPAGAH